MTFSLNYIFFYHNKAFLLKKMFFMINLKIKLFVTESVQYNAAFAITGTIKRSSTLKLYQELGLEHLHHKRWMHDCISLKRNFEKYSLNISTILFFPTEVSRKVSKYGVFSGPYLPVFGLNTGKYGREKAPYLGTFHAVRPS